MLDAVELVALSCVHGNGDGLTSGNLLEVVRGEALLLVVDEDPLERQSLAVCLFVRGAVRRWNWFYVLASATNKSLVACSLKTVLPLKT